MPQSFQEFAELLEKALYFKLFEINQTPVTPASLLIFLLVVIAFNIFSRVMTKGVLHRLLIRLQLDSSTRYTMVRVSHYLIMVAGTVFAFQFVGVDLSGLAVIFGLLSVGIGFGLQNVTSNFISGLILLLEQPIRVGDRVTVGDTEGDVLAINMRSTTIRTLNNISIIVPNSEFVSSNVINWSHGDKKIRLDIDVGVSYGSDLDLVLKALKEVAREHPKVMDKPEPDVLLRDFGDSSWNMQLRAWIGEARGYYIIQSEINCAIVRKFREYDIEIPFPQRDLHVRSPLPVPLSSGGEDVSS